MAPQNRVGLKARTSESVSPVNGGPSAAEALPCRQQQ
jgi:hypothetical protein